MKKLAVFLLAFFLLSLVPGVSASQVYWVKAYKGNDSDIITDLKLLPDGNIVAVGYTEIASLATQKPFVITISPNGSIKWAYHYQGVGDDKAIALGIPDTNHTLVAGYNTGYIWLIKLDKNGKVIWKKNYDISSGSHLTSLALAPNDDILLAGYTDTGDRGEDGWIIRLNKEGNVIWARTYGGSKDDEISSIVVTPTGNIIGVGKTRSFNAANYDAWIFQLDKTGNIKWQKLYGSNEYDQANSVSLAPNGDIVFAGSTIKGKNYEGWIVRMDRNGNIKWSKTYGKSNDDRINSVAITDNGDIIGVGYTTLAGLDNKDSLIVCLDEDGNLKWSKSYGGSAWDEILAVAVTVNGDIVGGGYTGSFGSKGYDAWILKLPPDGKLGEFSKDLTLTTNTFTGTLKPSYGISFYYKKINYWESSTNREIWNIKSQNIAYLSLESTSQEISPKTNATNDNRRTSPGNKEPSDRLPQLAIVGIGFLVISGLTWTRRKKSSTRAPEKRHPDYSALKRYLMGTNENSIKLTFPELEGILGAELPKSAKTHRAWWANDSTHSQAKAWLEAGWRVKRVDLEHEIVEFERITPENNKEKSGKARSFNKSPISAFPSELLNKYEPLEFLGEGGFAKVFKVKRKKDGKIVALKIPRIDERTSKTFIKEVSTWLHLDHKNIVRLYDVDILPIPYLEMEFVEGVELNGKTVRDLDDYPKPLGEEKALKLIRGIAEGLKHAHSKGIIHRDLKPKNVLLKADLTPKITDWGLAKIGTMSSTRSVLGYTPLYAAPEHLMPGRYGHTDARTDIWQLGVTFYELLTGKLPFEGYTYEEIFGKIVDESYTFTPPSKINPALAKYDGIFEKLLAKRKEDRYHSIEEFLNDLEKLEEIEKRKAELEKEVEELKKSLARSVEALKVSRSVEEALRNRRLVIETLGKLALAYAELNRNAELLNTLNDLKFYTVENLGDLTSAINTVELLIKEDLPLSGDFVERLKVLVHNILRENEV